jgi:hypothetical protein
VQFVPSSLPAIISAGSTAAPPKIEPLLPTCDDVAAGPFPDPIFGETDPMAREFEISVRAPDNDMGLRSGEALGDASVPSMLSFVMRAGSWSFPSSTSAPPKSDCLLPWRIGATVVFTGGGIFVGGALEAAFSASGTSFLCWALSSALASSFGTSTTGVSTEPRRDARTDPPTLIREVLRKCLLMSLFLPEMTLADFFAAVVPATEENPVCLSTSVSCLWTVERFSLLFAALKMASVTTRVTAVGR